MFKGMVNWEGQSLGGWGLKNMDLGIRHVWAGLVIFCIPVARIDKPSQQASANYIGTSHTQGLKFILKENY